MENVEVVMLKLLKEILSLYTLKEGPESIWWQVLLI
jgi:hypothetical protein